MENQKVMQYVNEFITDEIRKGKLVKSKEVLTMLPDLIDTVHIDRRKMRISIEQEFSLLTKKRLLLAC